MLKQKLFYKIISILEENYIEYAVLGNTSTYPEQILSDIDIMVLPVEIEKVKRLLWNLEAEDTKIWQLFQHEICAFYYIVASFSGNEVVYVQPDICSDYYRKGRKLLEAAYLLENNRIAEHKGGGSKRFKVLSPEKEFIYYLLKKIDKQSLSEKQFLHLKRCYNDNKKQCIKEGEKFWRNEDLQLICAAFDKDDFHALQSHITKLQEGIQIPRQKKWIVGIKNVLLKFRRVLNPTGYIIAVMGPDGSGKTTLLRQFTADITPAFRKIKIYHLFPKDNPGSENVNTDPHQLQPHSHLLSFFKLLYFVVIYNAGFLKNVYRRKVRSTLIIFDRYYDDLLIDPKRYRNSAAPFLVKLVGRLIPRPDFWIILDAPAGVIQSRKSEVSFEETERQRAEYKLFASSRKNAIIVDTNRSVETISMDLCSTIGNQLHYRVVKRHK